MSKALTRKQKDAKNKSAKLRREAKKTDRAMIKAETTSTTTEVEKVLKTPHENQQELDYMEYFLHNISKGIKVLVVTDNLATSKALLSKAYTQCREQLVTDTLFLLKPEMTELHVSGKSKIAFICKNSLKASPSKAVKFNRVFEIWNV